MPKIIINEIDRTTAGTPEYSNFAVAIPGFCKDDVDPTIFDDNGVYECNSLLDFENNIGICQATMTFLGAKSIKAAAAPTINIIFKFDADATVADGTECVETQEAINGQETKATVKTFNDINKFTAALNAAMSEAVIYTAIQNSSGEIGLLKSVDYIFQAVGGATSGVVTGLSVANQVLSANIGTTFDTTQVYYKLGSIGNDEEFNDATVTHYGNQIAYELLSLGYPVLYKAIWLTKDLIKLAAPSIELVDPEDVITTRGVAEALEASGTIILDGEDDKDAEIGPLQDGNFWDCLKDKAAYDFRYIVSGLLDNADAVNKEVLKIAEARQDCVALIDIDRSVYVGKTQSEAIAPIAKAANVFKSKYAALFAPSVTYNFGKGYEYINTTLPGYFHYLACASKADEKFAEWYAVAGYTRGISDYSIATVGCKFGETAIQALEPRMATSTGVKDEVTGDEINTEAAVNLIVKIKNAYYLWGNRTGYTLDANGLVASHFLNIRQLCTTIKKQVYVACRRLTFDPNSMVLWLNFRSRIEPLLKRMKADQGIKDYKLVPVTSNLKGEMKAQIHIVPIEAVEDFTIDLVLNDALGESTVEITEV